MMIRHFFVIMALTSALFSGFAGPAFAQAQPKLVSQSGDWAIFQSDAQTGKVCFIISQPKQYDPMPVSRHGDVYFYVSRRPGDNVAGEPSLKVGYEFRPNSQVTVTIGDNSFPFMTTQQYAFPDESVDMASLVGFMRAGADMRVTGTSARGTNVSYTFSLSGVTAGTGKLDEVCPMG
jgi:invasion protein IalB